MAKIEDTYQVDTRSNTSGLDKATNAVKKHGDAIEKAGRQAGGASGLFGKLRSVLGGVLGGLRNLVVGGLGALGGVLGNVLGKLFGGSKALGGLGKAAGAVGKAMSGLVKGLQLAGNTARNVFGAVGKVGAGFVQTAAKTAGSALSAVTKGVAVFGLALGALALAAPLLGGIGDTLDRVSPRASSALDRIGAAMGRVGEIFLGAIAEALVPLLEKLATAMEDPRFIAFVTMLAEKLGGAISAVVTWILEDFIPALVRLWEESEPVRQAIVEKLGKVFEWLANDVMPKVKAGLVTAWQTISGTVKSVATSLHGFLKANWTSIKRIIEGAWEAIKGIVQTAWTLVSGIIKVGVAILKGDWEGAWNAVKATVYNAWESIKKIISGAINIISGFLEILGIDLRSVWEGLGGIVEGVWGEIKKHLRNGMNFVIDLFNSLIDTFNNTVARLPGIGPIKKMKRITELAGGGIVNSPLLAVVGDNPRTPEVVAPLHELVGILKQALGGMGGGPTIHIHLALSPAGFATPEEGGRRAADAFVVEARRRGMRI